MKLEPEVWQGWNNLGANYLALGTLPDAETAFRNAVKRNPRAQAAWFNLGRTLLAADRPDAAFGAFSRARQSGPADREIEAARLDAARKSAERAAEWIESGRYEKARAMLLAVQGALKTRLRGTTCSATRNSNSD